jgi:myo-inositol-1(or 4)-monophosphatase
MILLSAASDLSLIEDAARDAGALARSLMSKPLDIKSKGAEGPVTNIDIAVNELLQERLLSHRPSYGWLSEENPDDPAARISKLRAFVIDPIDGTAALIAKVPQFTISIGIAENSAPFAGAIYNPMTDEMFLGVVGGEATLNGKPVYPTVRDKLEGARILGHKPRFQDKRWNATWPRLEFIERQSIAYRLALTAAGHGDATMLFGYKNEWDIAAGLAIVQAAGGRATDFWDRPIALNQRDPRAPGVVASGAELHALLIERTTQWPQPPGYGEQI